MFGLWPPHQLPRQSTRGHHPLGAGAPSALATVISVRGGKGEALHIVHAVCCGLDVHQATLPACRRRGSDEGQLPTQLRASGPTSPEVLARGAWLVAQDCPVVALERTGGDWKPISQGLSGGVEVVVGNAREIRPRPGKKTDKADAPWIAEL